MSNKHLSIALILNASILLFPSNLKFIPIAILGFIVFKKNKKINWSYLLRMSIPYAIIVFGVFYSNNLDKAFFNIQTGVSLFLYPLLFSLIPLKSLHNIEIRKINNAFIISTLIFSLSVFLYFFVIEDNSWKFLIQHYISLIDKHIYTKYQIHSIYLSLLVTLSVILSLGEIIKSKNKFSIFLYIVSIIYCLLLLAIMNKRASIILVFFSSLLFLLKLKNANIKRTVIIFFFILTGFFIGLIINLPRFNENSFLELKKIEESINNPKTSIGTRVVLNKASFKIFKDYPIFGVGTGDDKQILSKVSANLSNGRVTNYNSHNQFNSYLIKTGLLGFSFFLFYWVFLIKTALNSKDIIFICILFIFFGNMLIENILEREAGVLVFSFFISYFTRTYYKNEKK